MPDNENTGGRRLDRRVLILLGAMAVLVVTASSLKLSGSSIGSWNRLTREDALAGDTLLGAPKLIRIDEYSVTTPEIMSQLNQPARLSPENQSWGPERVPLVTNVPVEHWSMLFRPQYWGFFLVDPEHAFAFYWNMKLLLLGGGVLWLSMLLTGGDFWVSVFAATWVASSGFVQWWYSTPTMMPEMVGCFCLMTAAACGMAESGSRGALVAMSGIFVVAFVGFATCCYPPFQIPLLYLGAVIVIGRRLDTRRVRRPSVTTNRRGIIAIAAIAIVALSLAWLHDTASTLAMVRATSYPGGRASSGGDLGLAELFGGLYGFFMSQGSFPQGWGNVCEASNFVLLFPIPAALLGARLATRKRVSALQLGLVVYTLALAAWAWLGWPRALATLTGFRFVPGRRALLGLGLASILLCCVWLSAVRRERQQRFRAGSMVALVAMVVAVLGAFTLWANHAMHGFLRAPQACLATLAGSAAAVLLIRRSAPRFAACILAPNLIAYGLVNPVTRGLRPLTGTRLSHEVSALTGQAPGARWVAYGHPALADYLKATGAPVLNGTKVVPPLRDLRILDPEGANKGVYNRYAHVAFEVRDSPRASFTLTASDGYAVGLNPASDLMPALGVRFVVLPFRNADVQFAARSRLVAGFADSDIWIYELRADAPRTQSR
ncbi:MAG TPA: hypothetical protein VLW17_09105 [Thermoanaerobaculaceae bacterium]|nr:hypothetical protein [Thermoanaerobaculaceae bacterium]